MTTDAPGNQPDPENDPLQQEVEALRERNAKLEEKVSDKRKKAWTSGFRSTGVVALLVFATLFAMLTPVAIWGRNLVLNTDRYVQTMSPLATNPKIQADIVTLVDQQFDKYVDVKALVAQALPPRATTLLSGPIEAAASSLVSTVVTKFVQSPQFAQLWDGLNRTSHAAVVAILTGTHTENQAITLKNDVVSLNLGPIIEQVKTLLVNAGLAVAANVPVVGVTIKIADVHGIDAARRWVRLLDHLAVWLPFLSLLCFTGAALLARRRRRTLIAAGFCIAGAMALVGLSTQIGRQIYINNLSKENLGFPVTGTVYDTVVRFLREGIRILFVLALLFSLVLWLTGPSDRGVRFRAAASARSARVGHWSRTSPLVATLVANRKITSGAIAAVAALVLLLWTNPSSGVFLTVVVIAGALIVFAMTWDPGSDGSESTDQDLPTPSHA